MGVCVCCLPCDSPFVAIDENDCFLSADTERETMAGHTVVVVVVATMIQLHHVAVEVAMVVVPATEVTGCSVVVVTSYHMDIFKVLSCLKQEALLLQTDRATRCVSRFLASCCITV